MSNLLSYNRFSDFVSAIVDRKTRSLSIAVSSSTLYLKALTLRAETARATAIDRATFAATRATASAQSATDAAATFSNFKSVYLGIATTDPARSALNNPLLVGSFYIRQNDRRLRTVVSFSGADPVWDDASVAAHPDSVRSIGDPRYLMLSNNATQTVVGKVAFSESITFDKDLTVTGAAKVRNVTDPTAFEVMNARSVVDFIYKALPIGTIVLHVGAVAPAGWVNCDGTEYARSDGNGRIRTPDLRGRVVVGIDGSSPIGTAFGNTIQSANTSSNFTGVTLTSNKGDCDAGSSTQRVANVALNDAQHSHSVSVNVTQPSMLLNYIMRI